MAQCLEITAHVAQFAMHEVTYAQVLEVVKGTQSSYFKLTLVAGPEGAGKRKLLQRIAAELTYPLINLSLHLSQRLLDKTYRQRTLKAEETALELIDDHLVGGLCIDHTELLCSSSLKVNPLVLLQEASRNRHLIASWNGTLEGGDLVFGELGHPDYFRKKVQGHPVIFVSPEKLHLHLTT